MTITLNGKETSTEAQNITELLKEMGFEGKPAIVEYNQEALVASRHQSTSLQDTDKVEVFVLGAGG